MMSPGTGKRKCTSKSNFFQEKQALALKGRI